MPAPGNASQRVLTLCLHQANWESGRVHVTPAVGHTVSCDVASPQYRPSEPLSAEDAERRRQEEQAAAEAWEQRLGGSGKVVDLDLGGGGGSPRPTPARVPLATPAPTRVKLKLGTPATDYGYSRGRSNSLGSPLDPRVRNAPKTPSGLGTGGTDGEPCVRSRLCAASPACYSSAGRRSLRP